MTFSIPIHPFLLLTLLSLTDAQQWMISASASTTPCLDTAESYLIALRWLQIFQTDVNGTGTGAALVPSTLATNFTYFDEGASFGDVGPVYESAAEVEESVSGSGYSGSLVTHVQYSILTTFESCDTVVVRWESNSVSAKSEGVTVPEGQAIQRRSSIPGFVQLTFCSRTPVAYKGTDYLQVDLSTRLIYNVTSSSDLVNYYIQLGDDVIKAMS